MLQCSATCGGGWQMREVTCQGERGPSDQCSNSQKPEARQACDAGDCPTLVNGQLMSEIGVCLTGKNNRNIILTLKETERLNKTDSYLITET